MILEMQLEPPFFSLPSLERHDVRHWEPGVLFFHRMRVIGCRS